MLIGKKEVPSRHEIVHKRLHYPGVQCKPCCCRAGEQITQSPAPIAEYLLTYGSNDIIVLRTNIKLRDFQKGLSPERRPQSAEVTKSILTLNVLKEVRRMYRRVLFASSNIVQIRKVHVTSTAVIFHLFDKVMTHSCILTLTNHYYIYN